MKKKLFMITTLLAFCLKGKILPESHIGIENFIIEYHVLKSRFRL